MDEFEKDEPLTDGVLPEDESDEEAEALGKELESIRDMFQQELDSAMNDDNEEDPDDFIQELDSIEDEAEDETAIPPEKLCECCGEKRRDVSFGDDYPYCNDCRELMKANPFNFIGIVMIIFIFLVAGISLGLTVNKVDDYNTLLNADIAYSERKLSDAATAYQSYISSASENDISMRAVKNMIDTMATLGYYSNADALIGQYFTEKQLSLPWNSKYRDITKKYELLMSTSELINETFSEALSGDDFDYDEQIAKANKLIEENKVDEKYSQTFLEYVKYILMTQSDISIEDQLDQLLKMESIDEGENQWIYLSYILNTYGRLGDVENAKLYFEKSIAINAQEYAAYNSYADAYRFCDEPDADKIIDIAREAAAVHSDNLYPTFYRSYAIGYLLKGDTEKAMSNIELYLQQCSQSLNENEFKLAFNLYALCGIAADDDEAYEYASTALETYGYKLGKSVKKCKKNKMTIWEVLTEKGGDIA